MEKVIFREEKGGGFLAVFPEDYAKPDGYAAVAFTLANGEAIFEPYMEVNALYMFGCRIVHKNDKRIAELLNALENRYGIKFKVCEKITAEMNKKRLEWLYKGV